jgi:hypothetical protein
LLSESDDKIIKSDSFKPIIENSSNFYDEDKRPLLNGVVHLEQWMRELIQLAMALPTFQDYFFEIIENLLKIFLKECQVKYNEILSGKFIENNIDSDEKNWLNMKYDTDWKILEKNKGENNNNNEFNSFIKSNLYEKLLSLKSVNKDLFVDSSTNLILLANLNDSLDWISKKIIELSDEFNRNMEIQQENNNTNKNVVPIELEFFSKFKNLSDINLFTLKLDIRIRCFYYISEMKNVHFK